MPARRSLKPYEEFTKQEAALVDAFTNPKSIAYRNKLASYREAGYYEAQIPEGQKDDGRAARSAKVSADKLFKRQHITAEIEARFAKEYEALKMSVEETIARVSKMAGADLMEYLVEVPHVCPHCDAELEMGIEYVFDIKRMRKDGYGSILKDMMPTKYGTKFSFYPADAALRDLMKHHGVLEQKGTQTVNNYVDKAIMLANGLSV
jgi:rubrerythrin